MQKIKDFLKDRIDDANNQAIDAKFSNERTSHYCSRAGAFNEVLIWVEREELKTPDQMETLLERLANLLERLESLPVLELDSTPKFKSKIPGMVSGVFNYWKDVKYLDNHDLMPVQTEDQLRNSKHLDFRILQAWDMEVSGEDYRSNMFYIDPVQFFNGDK